MRKLLTLLMGLNECSSSTLLRKQYQKLSTALLLAQNESDKESDREPEQARRYKIAKDKLQEAFEKAKPCLRSNEEQHGSVTGSGLLLGEMLIDAGLITKEQLKSALETQQLCKPPLPLGRIFVARKLLTWEQLAYYLRLQDLLQLSPTHESRFSRQLIELGLINRAELDVLELDCETTGYSLFHSITRRGWIKPAILALLTNSTHKVKDKRILAEMGATRYDSINTKV